MRIVHRVLQIGIPIACACLFAAQARAAAQPSQACPSINRKQAATSEAKCYSLERAGLTRTFRIYMPHGQQGLMPLVLVLHGGGGTAGNMEWVTKRGFNRIADRESAVIVYPDGIGKGWNDGRTDLKSKSVKNQVDDLGYLRSLVHELAVQFPVDAKRVYATGISNGGLMSYRLACDAADVFAAVAPVAAGMSAELAPHCKPERPVSIAILNGRDDPIMPWDGGPIKILWSARGVVLSAQATATRWTELNRCGDLRDEGSPLDSVKDDGTSVVERTAHCAQGTEVRLYEVRGGGHTWPGGEPYLGERLVGQVSREIDANDVIWQFFKQHRLP